MSNKLILILDSQQLSGIQSCEYYFDLNFNQQLVPNIERAAFSRGKIIHDLFYLFYKSKINRHPYQYCVQKGLSFLKLKSKSIPQDEWLLLLRKYSEYCTYYRGEQFKPLAVEKGFSKLLYEDLHYQFIYEGRIDLVAKFPSEKYPSWIDHKSESQKEDVNTHSNQFIGYSWALGCTNGIINYIGMQTSKPPNEAFRRTIVTHRKDIISNWVNDTIKWYFKLANCVISKQWLKQRSNCKHYKCSLCIYFDICNQTNPNAKRVIIQKDFKVRETPWKAWD